MHSSAATVGDYLAQLRPSQREVIETVRQVIRKSLPEGYAEQMQYGMISYIVPLSLYPKGYLGKVDVALPYASLAAQKRYMSLYLMGVYGDSKMASWFRSAYRQSGKRLDMGKSCVRFKSIDDLPLKLIGEAVAQFSVADYILLYEHSRAR